MVERNLVRVQHRTEYQFSQAVAIGPHEVRLRPAAHCYTPISDYILRATPSDHYVNWLQDPFGNFLARFIYTAPSTSLCFEVELIAEIIDLNPFNFYVENYAVEFPFAYSEQLRRDLAYCLEVAESDAEITAWIEAQEQKSQPTINFLVELNQAMCAQIDYVIRLEPGIQTCAETLRLSSGSCRDIAGLLIQV